jgi:hypothetical protein
LIADNPAGDPIQAHLISPELLMLHRVEIGLTDQQIKPLPFRQLAKCSADHRKLIFVVVRRMIDDGERGATIRLPCRFSSPNNSGFLRRISSKEAVVNGETWIILDVLRFPGGNTEKVFDGSLPQTKDGNSS